MDILILNKTPTTPFQRVRLPLSSLLVFFTLGCSNLIPTECVEWQFESNHATCPELRSTRLYLSSPHTGLNFEMELVRNAEGDRLYLNLLTFEVPCGEIDIDVQIDDLPPTCHQVQVLEGGQRILFSCAATTQIIEALWNECAVTLYLANRQAKVTAMNFTKNYLKLNRPPLFEFSLRRACTVFLPHS